MSWSDDRIDELVDTDPIELGQLARDLLSALSWGWTIIANAGGGDWEREVPEWQEAAAKWRDRYHELLHSVLPPEAASVGGS